MVILAQQGETFGAEWQHAAGAPKKKEAKGRSLVGAAIPSVRLRLDGEFRSSMLATWILSSDECGADMLVWSFPDQSCTAAVQRTAAEQLRHEQSRCRFQKLARSNEV